MRARDLIFGSLAVVLLVGYIAAGQRVAPLLLPGAAATPTPPRPTGRVSAPTIGGTIAFILRGDVFVLTGGHYASRTEEGRSQTPAVTADGEQLYFATSRPRPRRMGSVSRSSRRTRMARRISSSSTLRRRRRRSRSRPAGTGPIRRGHRTGRPSW